MFSRVTKLTWLIRFFGFAKVAMIYYCKPKVIYVDDNSLEIKVPLNRRTRNHINSMYFGALSVGADITGGFLAMPHIQKSKRKNIFLMLRNSHKNQKIFFLYQNSLYSKTTADVDFNPKYLTNYLSALLAYDNQNNNKAIKYFKKNNFDIK